MLLILVSTTSIEFPSSDMRPYVLVACVAYAVKFMLVFCSLYHNQNFGGVKDTSGKVIPTVLTIHTLPSSRYTATETLVCSGDFLCEPQSRLNLIRAIAHFL